VHEAIETGNVNPLNCPRDLEIDCPAAVALDDDEECGKRREGNRDSYHRTAPASDSAARREDLADGQPPGWRFFEQPRDSATYPGTCHVCHFPMPGDAPDPARR
jgi:hypothetical protein